MVLNTFSAGVNTSFSTQLNQNFVQMGTFSYRNQVSGSVSVGSSMDWTTIVTMNVYSSNLTNSQFIVLAQGAHDTGGSGQYLTNTRLLMNGTEIAGDGLSSSIGQIGLPPMLFSYGVVTSNPCVLRLQGKKNVTDVDTWAGRINLIGF